jgi:HK97 family phage prohead protease
MRIAGLAAPYGVVSSTPFPDGTYVRFLPGAFRAAIRQPCELWAVHSERVRLASTTAGTLTLSEGDDGLHITATLPDNEHGHTARLMIARRRFAGMSIQWRDADVTQRRVIESGRTILEISHVRRLIEVSLAIGPRFPTTWVATAPYRAERDANESRRIRNFFQTL